MSDTITFDAVIRDAGGGAFVSIPFDVEQTFGKKRVPVKATFDGEPYRGSVVRMGGSDHLLIVLKEIREKIGKQPGDTVRVTLSEDTEPRVVEVPEDMRAALSQDADAERYFGTLSYSHQREYVAWVEGAKRAQTRESRIARAMEMLAAGKKLK